LKYWLAQRSLFGASDKIVDNNIEAWCIGKIIRLVGPIEQPVDPEDKMEIFMGSYLKKSGCIIKTREEKRFISVGTVREEMEKISGIAPELIDFLQFLLAVDHRNKPAAREVLEHPYLTGLSAQLDG
jgi:hypothetical protein